MGNFGPGRVRKPFFAVGLALLACIVAALSLATLTRPQVVPRTKAASSPALVERKPSRVDYTRFDARVAKLMGTPDMVGLAVATVEQGQVRFIRGYGETLAQSGVRVTPDTVFRWASLSKGVASALVVDLAGQRKLSLATPLRSMGTSLTLPGDWSRVTIADLLSHRLGLVRNAWDERLEAGEDPKLLRAALGTLPPFCPPASCYGYQNIAFDTISEIVERLTGQDYAATAKSRLFAPLGMHTASIGRAALERARGWARPHHRGKVPIAVNDAYYRIPAAGGVNSSIRDLAVWMQAQMGGAPAVLPLSALEAMHRPRVSTPPHGRRSAMDRALTNAAYGLGWRHFTYAGHTLVGHRGAVDGFGALILFDPSERSGIVMLWNSNAYQAARLQLEFFDMLYGLPPTDWLELDRLPASDGGTGESAIRKSKRL